MPQFNCEIEFEIQMKNNRVSGQYVNVYSKRGSETLKRFEYSKNVSNVTRQMDISQVATAMIGIGKNGLTFKDAEWTSKDPAIKPKNQDFVVNAAAYEKWNRQGEHIVGIYENNEVENAYELLRLTWEELKKVSDPKFTYEVDTVMIQSDEDEISIGDTVYVIDHEYDSPLFLEARIGQLSLSFTDHTQNKCKLTNFKEVKSGIRKQLSEDQVNDIINSYFPIGGDKLQNGAITDGKIDTEYYKSIKTDIVQASVADVGVLIADKANISDLDAINATIENLKATDIDVTGKLTANEAEIKSLKANDVTITGSLNASNAEIDKLKANDVIINGSLSANQAQINELKANNVTISGKLEATVAEVGSLKADVAEIGILKADVAEIETVLAGNITAKNIQAGSITAKELAANTITSGSAIIANGAIGSAQISELEASKINAGTIDTSKVTVAGPNSNLKMSGNRLQVFQGIGSQQKERVSLGDVNGDGSLYGLRVRGADGKTVLLDENGVKSEGLTDGSITNDKISGDANIDGAKLNINSVINKINKDGSETIQGTKIDIEGTNLSAKLSTITTTQTDQNKKISENSSKITANEKLINLKVDSQTYQIDQSGVNTKLNKATSDITAMKGEIALKVEQTDIENSTSALKGEIDTKVNAAKSEIKITTDKISQNVSSLSSTVEKKADGSTVTALSNKVGTLETSVNGIKGEVSSLETTTTTIKSTADNALSKANAADNTANSKAKVFTAQPTIPYKVGDLWTSGPSGELMRCKTARSSGVYTVTDWEKASKYTDDSKANAVDGKVNTLQGEVTTVKSNVATLDVNLQGITQRVSSTESTTTTLNTKVNTAQSTADTAKNNAQTAQNTANTANATANANKTEIASTKTKVSSIETNLTGITSRVGSVETNQTAVNGKVTALETWKKTAEQKITDNSIVSTVKAAKETNGKNTFAQQSDITQLNDSWTAKFSDGYNQGIVAMNKNGITVTSTAASSKTSMSANGFKITRTANNEDIFKVNSDGTLALKGSINGSSINGSSINGSTFTSANNVFKVLNDGTVETNFLNVNDEISTDKLIVDEIINSKYQAVLDGSTTVYIKAGVTSATSFENGAVYASIEDLKDIAPRNLNGYTFNITLQSSISEDVVLNNFNNGQVNFNLCGFTIKGYLYCYGTSMVYRIYGNKTGSTGGTTRGKIMPNIGREMTGNRYGIVFDYTKFLLYDIDFYKGKATDKKECAVGATNMSIGYVSDVKMVNKPYMGLRCHAATHVYSSASSGLTESYAFSSVSGSIIQVNNVKQMGRSGSTSHTHKSGNGQVFADGVTYDTVAQSGNNDSTTGATTKTATITSNSGDSYRKTVYNNWKKDGTVRQGDYGYGDNVGCWFFGEKLADYSSKNISKVTITVKRQTGGSSAAVTHGLKMHSHASRPGGVPTYRTDFAKNFSLAVGNSTTITLSTAEEIAAFKKCKGFGLVPASQSSGYYSVCSGSATVKITYKE